MILKAYCVIVEHICEVHGPESCVFGPFVDREQAEAFMARGLAKNPGDMARVEPLGLNAKNLAEVLMLNMGSKGLDGIDIDGPII